MHAIVLFIALLPAQQEKDVGWPLIGKWQMVRYTRGSYNYPDSMVNHMSVYFTDRLALLRFGDKIGESTYTIRKQKDQYLINLVANDGNSKGEETWGLATYDPDAKILKWYMSVKPGIRPTSIPSEPAADHDLIIMHKLDR